MTDFVSSLQAIEKFLCQASKNFVSKLDQMTFRMLVNNLKSLDYYVVSDTLDQLEREKRSIAIPAVYYVGVAHPDLRLRQKAQKALQILDPQEKVKMLTLGKSNEEAVRALIEYFGNFTVK